MGSKSNFLARAALSLVLNDRERMSDFIEQKLREHFNTEEDFNAQAVQLVENLLMTMQQDLLIKAATSKNTVSEEKIDRLLAEIEKLNQKLDKQ